jgi:hypothetical protein
MSTPTITPAPATEAREALTACNGCDKCGYVTVDSVTLRDAVDYIPRAVAYVRVLFPNGTDLDLCGHCYAESELLLNVIPGAQIQDERSRLDVKISSFSVHSECEPGQEGTQNA